MGTFDEVHTGERCGQVKALGKGLRALVPGDAVVLRPSVLTQEQFAEHGHEMPARTDVPNFDVQMPVGFLHVRDGRLTGWDEAFDPDIPMVDYLGWPIGKPTALTRTAYDAGADLDSVVPRWNCQVCATQREPSHPPT